MVRRCFSNRRININFRKLEPTGVAAKLVFKSCFGIKVGRSLPLRMAILQLDDYTNHEVFNLRNFNTMITTMKKLYVQPAVQVVKFETEGMLAASSNFIQVNPNEQGTPATKEHIGGWDCSQWS